MEVEETNRLTLSILEKARAYHRWIFETVNPWLGNDILEVGCGIGNLTGWLLQAARVTASDLNPHHLRRVDEKFGRHPNLKALVLWDIEEEMPKGPVVAFDTILCSNVLEHVKDDQAVLSRFYGLLPRGGRLVLLVPALRILYNSLDRELGHFRRYTKKELIQKISRVGFRICCLRYFNFFGMFGWFVSGTLLRRGLLPEGQVETFDRLVPFMVKIERWVPPLWGQSLIAIGEKRERNLSK